MILIQGSKKLEVNTKPPGTLLTLWQRIKLLALPPTSEVGGADSEEPLPRMEYVNTAMLATLLNKGVVRSQL